MKYARCDPAARRARPADNSAKHYGRRHGKHEVNIQPFGMLVGHRVNDVNKRLVTIEQSMATSEQITFKPAFALMFAQHFHHAPGRLREVKSFGVVRGFPLVRFVVLKDGFQTDWKAFQSGQKMRKLRFSSLNFVTSRKNFPSICVSPVPVTQGEQTSTA